MLIPVLDITGNQIAWIDHLNLEEGSLFRDGEMIFRLRDDGVLQEVTVHALATDALIEIAANDD